MEDEKLKYRIGANIAAYRKRLGWTQAGMAERLNYSDKAVSKWERGESVPDVLTLDALAREFGVTVNDLLADPETQAETLQQLSPEEKKPRRRANRNVILGLSSLLVWFVALLTYVVLSTVHVPGSWMPFICAIPVDAIVKLSLRSAWHDFRWNQALISAIVWGGLLVVYMSLCLARINAWKIFLLGIPGQAAVCLWFRMFRPSKGNGEENDGQKEP